jgi:predicted ester cyclase
MKYEGGRVMSTEANKAVYRRFMEAIFNWTGTHQGVFNDIPPTGKQVTVTGLDLWLFRDGRCIKHWNQEDNLGLLQQLGVIPAAG